MRATLVVNDTALEDIELVVFDKDGTMIDVHAYWSNMIRLRVQLVQDQLKLDPDVAEGLMEAMGIDVARMRVKPDGPVGIRKREIVLQAGVDYLRNRARGDLYDLLFNAFREADIQSQQHLSKIVQPIDGVHTLIRQLKAAECRVAVATSDRTYRATLAVRQLGLDDAIDCVAGADRVPRAKPAPDMLYMIGQSLGVRMSHTVMIGDAIGDVQTGLNAGCRAVIGVTSGLTERATLAELTPYVVNSVADITASPTRAESAA
jgi:phosphoglycolate phosphatase